MMLHNLLEQMQGRKTTEEWDICLETTGTRQSALGGKVTRKHDDLQEIAYETFGLASPTTRRQDSCRMLVTNKVSGQMGVWEHMWLRWTTNDRRTHIIKMIQKYSQ